MFSMTAYMNPDGPWTVGSDMMRCAVCFDVREEDGAVEEGTDGFGGCYYNVGDVNYFDANYLGTVEA